MRESCSSARPSQGGGPRGRVRVGLGFALLAVLSACDAGLPERTSATSAPHAWTYAVLAGPSHPVPGDGSTGRAFLLDDDGSLLRAVTTEAGAFAGSGTTVSDGERIVVTGFTTDTVISPFGDVHTREREHRPEADEVIAVGGFWKPGQGRGLVLYNNGVRDSPRGYRFIVTELDQSGSVADFEVDGYLEGAWSCGGSIGVLARDMSTYFEEEESQTWHVSRLKGATFVDSYNMEETANTTLPPTVEFPCVGDSAVAIVGHYTTDDEGYFILQSRSLRFFGPHGHEDREVTWSKSAGVDHEEPARFDGIDETSYYWIDAMGHVYSVPLAGGNVRLIANLQGHEDFGYLARAEVQDGLLHLFWPNGVDGGPRHDIVSLDTGEVLEERRLSVPLPDGMQIHDIVVRNQH